MKAMLLAEHLAALSVTVFVVLWLTMVQTAYREQVVPMRTQTLAVYAARVALMRLGPGHTGTVTVQSGAGPQVVRVTPEGMEVTVDGQVVWQQAFP
ncbi:hypothetical protein [Lacticaseibacillus absianus]|uniref:hypothetical protein n=1 Tax=Lacticaseibacillus absianus TaxID=2729623 RepID=UPI0015CC0DBC|nr:hypothetical protein [Lacticaseibacillus absianus]